MTQRPTPRRRRKDARPSEIVSAALSEFAERGFAATRLDDVAERAGISKGTIYLYFDTKEALFEAVVRDVLSPVLDRMDLVQRAEEVSSRDALRFVIETLYREVVATERRMIMRMLIADSARFPALVETYHREAVGRGKALLKRIVAHGVARGELREGPATRHPEVILGPAIMAAVWKLLFENIDPLDLEAHMNAHLDLVLNGLTRSAPPPAD